MGDILIVDDEKDIRELVSDILIDEGYTTQLAANSEDTFKSIEKSKPKLIILDIWLKESKLDGIDILKQVKLNNPDIPVVIISGHGNIVDALQKIPTRMLLVLQIQSKYKSWSLRTQQKITSIMMTTRVVVVVVPLLRKM